MEKTEKIVKTEEEWRAQLDPDQYEVLRHAATEPPFTGRYVNEKGDGGHHGKVARVPDGTAAAAPGS